MDMGGCSTKSANLATYAGGRFQPDRLRAVEMELDIVKIENTELIKRLSAIEASPFWRASLPFRALLSRHPRVRRLLRSAAASLYRLAKPLLRIARLQGRRTQAHSYAQWILQNDTLSKTDRKAIGGKIRTMGYKPVISIVMPVYNTREKHLREAISSVLGQLYPYWELCIADDCSTEPHVKYVLEEIASDPRIRIVNRPINGNISAASNSALAEARGEFIALMDHDDILPEKALFEIAAELNLHSKADVIYSDEDRIDDAGRRSDPYFKSDWNPELMLGHNMISHLGVYRRTLIERIGGFREGYEGSQDYDLALRAIDATRPELVRHIPAILYHWRRQDGRGSFSDRQLARCSVAARRAIADHLERRNLTGRVVPHPLMPTWHQVAYDLPEPLPLVSIIIPTRDRADLLRQCLSGILDQTNYANFEIIIVDNGSSEPATRRLFKSLRKHPQVRIVPDDRPFNYSALNNKAASLAQGEILLLLNNDIKVIEPGWLKELVRHAVRPEIGAVGAKLLYEDGRVQHGGIVLGVGGIANHFHHLRRDSDPGYFGLAALTQNVSAVTGACLAVRRKLFHHVGGLDEENLAVAFNDVDFCLKLVESGYRNVWTPHAKLIHLESVSRGADTAPEKRERFQREIDYMRVRWYRQLARDRFYNVNFCLTSGNFNIASTSRRVKPWLMDDYPAGHAYGPISTQEGFSS